MLPGRLRREQRIDAICPPFNLDFLASSGQSRRPPLSRLNRAVRPQKSAAESPDPLGVLKTQAASRSQVPLAGHAAAVARYPVKRRRHKTHPHQKDSRRRAPTASARAFCRRNRLQNTLAQSEIIRRNRLSRKPLRTRLRHRPWRVPPPKTGRLIRTAIQCTTTGGASACYATRITRVPNRREFAATACQTAVSSLG